MESDVRELRLVIRTFARSWRSLAWRGAFGVVFGAVTLLWPRMTLTALVLLFGVYALLDGIAALAVATRAGAREHLWALTLEGLAGVGIGLAASLWTRMAIDLLALLIAFWAIATGVLECVAAVQLGRELPGASLIAVGGIASLALGCAILLWPTAGALALVVLVGAYALVFGAAMLAQALHVRQALRHLEDGDRHGHSIPRAV